LEKARRDNPLPESAIAAPAALAAAKPEPVQMVDNDDITETDIQTSIERARAMVKAAQDRMQAAAIEAPSPATQPAAVQQTPMQPSGHSQPGASTLQPVPAASPVPATAEQRHRLMWADAMTAVAGELSANLAIVPPAQRGSDRMWASALSSSASSLAMAAGSVPPDCNIGVERVDKRAKSG